MQANVQLTESLPRLLNLSHFSKGPVPCRSPAGRTSRQNELLKLGYEWGESRIIIGYHWKSDVEAARALASAVYARLHASEEFLTDMAAARREFAKLTK